MKALKRWKTRIGLLIIVLIAISVLFLKVPLYYQARSYLVMSVYSKYEERSGLPAKLKFNVDIPGGSSTEEKDWYPFMMVFNDDQGFSNAMGRDLSLTIFYNFGAFSWNTSSSYLFQEDSPYFSSFYGAYFIKENAASNKYAFLANGELVMDEVFAVPEYDYKHLVLESLGCPADKLAMEILSYNITKNVQYAGYDDWTQVDSLLLVNSPVHKYKMDRRAYIQYGNPLKQADAQEFGLMTTNGRMYIRYFPEYECTAFLYIMSPNILTVEKCDKEILSKTIIGNNK